MKRSSSASSKPQTRRLTTDPAQGPTSEGGARQLRGRSPGPLEKRFTGVLKGEGDVEVERFERAKRSEERLMPKASGGLPGAGG
jgi:hypothetical protein